MQTAAEVELQYYLPPEWAPQSGVMLTWPHSQTIWAETLDTIDKVFAEICAHIAQREKVLISCFDHTHRRHILDLLSQAGASADRVNICIAPCDDVWVRDHGPVTVLQHGKPRLLDFRFNGWGEKYPHANDNKITQALFSQHAFGGTPITSLDMVLEGGGIEVDGMGTLLTTSSCLLASTRNPSLTREDIARRLGSLFGLKKIHWLDYGALEGDDTDGHIDTLARFLDPHTICYITCDDPDDEHYDGLKAMEAQLQTLTDYQGKPYHLVPLPWPQARFADYDGRRLPATYANFLFINDALLVPVYDDPADTAALEIFSRCLPQRKIIPVNCLPVIQWYGSLHCMTMQLPEGVLT